MHCAILALLALLSISACPCSAKAPGSLRDFPEEANPAAVGTRIVRQFISADPFVYAPAGYDGDKPHGWRVDLTYAIVNLWTASLEFSSKTENHELEGQLIEMFEPYRHKRNADNHVDHSVFGALPLEIYLLTGDTLALRYGLGYADHQWETPDPKHPGGTGNRSYEEQLALLSQGYSPQTRLWIDDIYMINLLQTQAFRATGKMEYLERAAKETVLYLDTLQESNGLFHHSASSEYDWGRGNGWIAAGMTLLLEYLPHSDSNWRDVMRGYRKMMKTLLKYQRSDGLWGQLVTDPDSWDETSGSAMFTFAFVEGVKRGWLPERKYEEPARRAWIALCGKLDEHANVSDVCAGTDEHNDHNYYLTRPRVNGDPHGQAAMMWICNALLEPQP